MNNITIKGRLTRSVEIKQAGEHTIGKFCVAVDRGQKTEGKQNVDFFEVEAWNKSADFIGKYFEKGQEILLRGEMRLESYQDKENKNRIAPKILMEKCYFCGSKANSNPTNEYKPTVTANNTASELSEIAIKNLEDDLPF